MVEQWIMRMFQILYTFLNFLLFVDLCWIIKNPFYPQSIRNTRYKTATAVLSAIIFSELVTISTMRLSPSSASLNLDYTMNYIEFA